MISVTRLLQLKADLRLLRDMEARERATHRAPFAIFELEDRLGTYVDILEDWLLIQQRSA